MSAKAKKSDPPPKLRISQVLVMDQSTLARAQAKAAQHGVPFTQYLEEAVFFVRQIAGQKGNRGPPAHLMAGSNQERLRKPAWLRRPLPAGPALARMERGLRGRELHTICEEGRCPNRGECFASGVATLLIMGRVCTRDCRFCAVAHGRPGPLDPKEPQHVAGQVHELGLAFAVITSVTRDDLPDGGAGHFAQVTRAIRQVCPGTGLELLIPDFEGSETALATVLEARPQVLAHNVETVPRLYDQVRPQADYQRSLQVLARAALWPGVTVKSGLMLGLGETRQEITQVLGDLREAGCSVLTLGQYLAPSLQTPPGG